MDVHDKLRLAETMRDASRKPRDDRVAEFLDKHTRVILENKAELEKYVVDDWSLTGLWSSLRLSAAKARGKKKREEEFPWELTVHQKPDSELSDSEFQETLYRIVAQALMCTDPTAFELRVRSLETRADPDDPDQADAFGAMEVEIRVAREVRRGFVKKPEPPPKRFCEWLEGRRKIMKQNINSQIDSLTLRPGERERQMRNNMGVEVTAPGIVRERSRSPMAVAFVGEDPFEDPLSRGAAYLLLFDGICRAKGYPWWENSVLLARNYFEKRRRLVRDKPTVIKNLGRFDVLHDGILWETEDAISAIHMWLKTTKEPLVAGIF